jgi:hypothetical protein
MGAWLCTDCASGRELQPLHSLRCRHCDECGRATDPSDLHHVSIGEIQRKARELGRAAALEAFGRALEHLPTETKLSLLDHCRELAARERR